MICARGKGEKRKLKLVARQAARRFTLRRDAGKSANAWLPLVLRWRQRRSARRDVGSRGWTSRGPQTSLTQTHFHFVTHPSSSDRARSAPRTFPAATIYRHTTLERSWANKTRLYLALQNQLAHRRLSPSVFAQFSVQRERIVLDQDRTNVATINGVLQPRFNGASLISYFIQRSQSQRIIEKTESLTPSRSLAPTASRPGRRQRRAFVAQISPATMVNARRDELTHVFKTHWHTRDFQPLVLSRREPATEAFTPPRQMQGNVARVQFDHPEELVWRRTQPPVTKYEAGGRAGVFAAGQRHPVRTAVEETPAQTASPAISRTAPQQITKLDPALVDRLTDDVIRRVEQRARIERQRRGL